MKEVQGSRPPTLSEVANTRQFAGNLQELIDYPPGHDVQLDTYGLQLDGLLERIHAAESYFDEFPGVVGLNIPVNPPMKGNEEGAGDAHFVLTREGVHTMKEIALTRYCDLAHLSELGHELARDILKSWDTLSFSWTQLIEEYKAKEK